MLLADGTSKPIENVETDDEVLAYDPETSQTEKRRVVRTYVHEDKPTYDVVVEDGEKVTATSEHPFMVEGKGYTPVDELEKGDLLVRHDGSTIEVLSVNSTGETATVHNFEVEGLHNYYVRAGDHWLLVHNECATKPLVLGIRDHLDDFAAQHGGETYKALPEASEGVDGWKRGVTRALTDPQKRVLFNLDGVDAWPGVTRAAQGKGGATDWELLQVKMNDHPNLEFWKDGVQVGHPFR